MDDPVGQAADRCGYVVGFYIDPQPDRQAAVAQSGHQIDEVAKIRCRQLQSAGPLRPARIAEHREGPRRLEALARTTSPMWLARTIAASLGFTPARPPAREAASAAIPEILLHLRQDIDNLDTTAAAVFNL